MSDAKIKEAWQEVVRLTNFLSVGGRKVYDAYIQAEARARMAEHKLTCEHYAAVEMFMCHKCRLTLADYEAEVRKELSE